MQLPRGTFREIRKTVAIEDLLQELDGEKFSGVANISSPSRTGTLVFKAGKCILVKIQNSRGDAAWDEIQKAGSEQMDAALSLLDDAQIALALEFNKPCRILKSGKQVPARASPRSAPSASPEPSRPVPTRKPAAPVAPQKPPVKPETSHHHVPAPHPPPVPKSAGQNPQVPPAPALRHDDGNKNKPDEPPGKDQNTSSFDTDLDTFDSMDIDNVTDKIRTDCKTMIKQLHLEHLMER